MSHFDKQVERIKEKLQIAKKIDGALKVFGASSHQYFIGEPIAENDIVEFEKEYGVELPGCYRTFLTQIGNGGLSCESSAAGPSYGIYPLGFNVDEIIDLSQLYLKEHPNIFPTMTEGEWKALCVRVDAYDELSGDDFDHELGKIYSGVLPIGSLGCTYLQAIIVSGEFKGKVIYVALERDKPFFTFEKNFLDWYERWLNEIISGDLLQDGPNMFGCSMGGTDNVLLDKFLQSDDINTQCQCLFGLLKKARISVTVLDSLENIYASANDHHDEIILSIMTKSDYPRAEKYLKKKYEANPLPAFQNIFWHAKHAARDWLPEVELTLAKDDVDLEAFEFANYIAHFCKVDLSRLVRPKLKHQDSKVRAFAKYSLEEFRDIRREKRFFGLFDVVKQWFQ